MRQNQQNAWLWWIAAISLTIGLSIFLLIPASEYDPASQKYRPIALVAGILIAGLCLIVGTRGRWFGRGL